MKKVIYATDLSDLSIKQLNELMKEKLNNIKWTKILFALDPILLILTIWRNPRYIPSYICIISLAIICLHLIANRENEIENINNEINNKRVK